MSEFTHINEKAYGKALDVSTKEDSIKEAIAKGSIYVSKDILEAIIEGRIKKGDVLSVSKVAGIMAAKNTSDLIPMCENINIMGADIEFFIDKRNSKIDIKSTVKTLSSTGVEMQALTSVSVAALTIYDMCKGIGFDMVISDIYLEKKTGCKSEDVYNNRLLRPDVNNTEGELCSPQL